MRSLLLSLALVLLPTASHAEIIPPAVALERLEQPGALLIDVRTAEEFADGALPGARLIPHGRIAEGIAGIAPDKDTPIVLYCRSGRRASVAEQRLRALGYDNVVNAGGYEQLAPLFEPRP